ncbi:hypothetical protein [Aeromonas media]|uniref:hypothetical protein n=1 Tax=Aeromonas media TaxID=651 RepID=UPI0029D4A0BF|nr:hypothetical protein [Aeromonas media]MDX7900157.1 hypothetical protein [Aeromonas media]
MTENARERLKMLITLSGMSREECEHDGVLEELIEDSTLFGSDHNEVLCVLEAWSGPARRKLLLEFLFDE